MTARDSLDTQPTAFGEAVLLYRLKRVLGACGRVDASGPEEGRDDPLVPPDGPECPRDEP